MKNEIKREPGCTCAFDFTTNEPLIGGYARCPVHDPNMRNREVFPVIPESPSIQSGKGAGEAAYEKYPKIIGYRQVGLQDIEIDLNLEKREIFLAGVEYANLKCGEKDEKIKELEQKIYHLQHNFFSPETEL